MKRKQPVRHAPPPLPLWTVAIPIVLPFAAYVCTAAPGVTLVDSGELALACRTLGMAHPPGFPFYVLLGHVFSLLPLSADIARRTNLFSALCAALAAGMSYLLTRELLRDLDHALALAGALAFGFSLSLWSWAVVTEVYALNILMLTVLLYFAARGEWWRTALAAGLALGVHHATIVMALPAAILLLWTRRRPTWRDLGWAALAGAAGLCVYLYLPLTAMRDPVFNWGDPRTFERLYWQISARQYQVNLFSAPIDEIAAHTLYFARLWLRQMTHLGFVVAGIGLVSLAARNRRVFWFTALLIALNVGFALNYDIAEDIEGYYLPTFLAGAWCFAMGAEPIVKWSGERRNLAMSAMFGLALTPAVANFGANNRHADRIAPLYVENSVRGVEAGALIVTSDWQFYSPWLYRRFVEGLRPDVVVVDTLMLRRSWYLDFLARQYPAMTMAAQQEMTAFRGQLDRFEHDQPYDPGVIDAAFNALVEKFISVKAQEHTGVYFTQRLERPFVRAEMLTPRGILYRMGPPVADIEMDLSGLLGGVPLDDTATKVKDTYATMLAAQGKTLTSK